MSHNIITIGTETVTKLFSSQIGFDMELYILQLLQKSKIVPKLKAINNKEIIMERIYGDSLYEYLQKFDENIIDDNYIWNIFKKVIDKLEEFEDIVYRHFGKYINLTDCHYRNFIVNEDNVTFIDLEGWEFSDKEDIYVSFSSWIKCYHFQDNQKLEELFKKVVIYCETKINCRNNLRQKIEEKILQINSNRYSRKIIKDTDVVVVNQSTTNIKDTQIGSYSVYEHILYKLDMFDKRTVYELDKNFEVDLIYKILMESKANYVFVLSKDAPNISEQFIYYLFGRIKSDNNTTIVKNREGVVGTLYNRNMVIKIIQENKDVNSLLYIYQKLDVSIIEVPLKFKDDFMSIKDAQLCLKHSKDMYKLNLSPLIFID